MEELYSTIKENAKNNEYYAKNKMVTTLDVLKSYLDLNVSYIHNRKFNKYVKIYQNLRDHCHFTNRF